MIRKLFFLATFIQIIFVIENQAQTSLITTVGPTFFHTKDNVISRSVYSGPIQNLGVLGQFGRSQRWQVHLILNFGTVNSAKNHQLDVNNYQLQGRYGFFSHDGERMSHTLYLSLSTELMKTKARFISDGEPFEGRTSGFIDISTNIGYTGAIALSKQIDLKPFFYVGLLSYTVRPGYSTLEPDDLYGEESRLINILRTGQLYSPAKRFQTQAGFAVYNYLADNVSLYTSYTYGLNSITAGNTYRELNHHLNVGFVWQF